MDKICTLENRVIKTSRADVREDHSISETCALEERASPHIKTRGTLLRMKGRSPLLQGGHSAPANVIT